jgi:CBS domain-containing protein
MPEGESRTLSDLKGVKDIMIPVEQYPSVRLTDTLKQAMIVIEGARLGVGRRQSLPRVLLVFDHEGDLVGVVRRRDIMRGLEPSFLVDQPLEYRVKLFDVGVDHHLTELSKELSPERVLRGLREQADRPVGEVMRPVATTLKPDDRLLKAVYEMVSLNESLIPVVRDDQVLGVVRSVDVFHELARLVL